MTATMWKNHATMVEFGGGYHQPTVRKLLTVAGNQAAGARIVETIERELAAQHIELFPTQIPRDQNAFVLLYNQERQGPGSLLHLVRQLTETKEDAAPA
jgi:hypothetical protein